MIDWPTHWGGVRESIKAMEILAAVDASPRTLVRHLRYVALRARSRHIPDSVRREFPTFPWKALTRFLILDDSLIVDGRCGTDEAGRLAKAFALEEAQRVAAVTVQIEERLMSVNADGNARNGVLERSSRGDFLHLTLRVPARAEGAVMAAVAAALADEPAPTVDWLRGRLADHSDRIAALGVAAISVVGSVSRGEAAPCSDVDLLYRAADPTVPAWGLWSDLGDLLEGILGKVVDLHAEEGYDHPFDRPVSVWSLEEAQRDGR